ncbi:hypothetical protein ACOME3_008655 [Neoechinorhynchus agilis]
MPSAIFGGQPVNTIQHLTQLQLRGETIGSARRTGIICTLGPASQNVEMLVELMNAGMNVARLNFSHGTHEYHRESIENIRKAEKVLGWLDVRPIAIALDTRADYRGPEIRTGLLKDDPKGFINLRDGECVTFTTDATYESASVQDNLYVTYNKMPNLLEPGNHVYADDGLINLVVRAVDRINGRVRCEVVNGGKLGSRKGINLPDIPVDLPAVSDKDVEDIRFGMQMNIDYIFASFVRDAEAIRQIRKILLEHPNGKHIKIIAKLENQQGLDNLDEIIKETDGIMVARGDMGIEIPPQKVFVAQKIIISKCNLAGIPVICATQMLESMTYRPRATRAEVSDVANAVLDGADCVMLSGETAKGEYPIQCVSLMDAIAREAERCMNYIDRFESLRNYSGTPINHEEIDKVDAAAVAAVEASFRLNASIIIVLTSTGQSARNIAKYQPKAMILAVTRDEKTARALNLHRGCHPILYEDGRSTPQGEYVGNGRQTKFYSEETQSDQWMISIDRRVEKAIQVAKVSGYVRKNDGMICVTGWRTGVGSTNTIRIMYCE